MKSYKKGKNSYVQLYRLRTAFCILFKLILNWELELLKEAKINKFRFCFYNEKSESRYYDWDDYLLPLVYKFVRIISDNKELSEVGCLSRFTSVYYSENEFKIAEKAFKHKFRTFTGIKVLIISFPISL